MTPTQTQKSVVGGETVNDENWFVPEQTAKMVKNSSPSANDFLGESLMLRCAENG